jgi:hypothetical protein
MMFQRSKLGSSHWTPPPVVYSSCDLVEVSSCNAAQLGRSGVKSVARLMAFPKSKALTAWADGKRCHVAMAETAENNIVGLSNEKLLLSYSKKRVTEHRVHASLRAEMQTLSVSENATLIRNSNAV